MDKLLKTEEHLKYLAQIKVSVTQCELCDREPGTWVFFTNTGDSRIICRSCKALHYTDASDIVVIDRNDGSVEPNEYDLEATCNGCGNHFTADILGIDVDFIFYLACRLHDWRYSEYSKWSRLEADKQFLIDMRNIIDEKENELNDIEEGLYYILSGCYESLVSHLGAPSFKEFDPSKPMPSFQTAKHPNIRAKGLKTYAGDFPYGDNKTVFRWLTEKDAYKRGIL